ncbi:hypothetical protein [Pseudomonas vanderleydeniana]|uniref:Uncharacterized protein n=1 Tax=Pseudomonas vanderleydeniana TaxID=2745495 RepID=A0A9E6TSG8_9PSED|nr:hypothetical protein [Pseudomonas vanderleydeniana]QXI28155.1 hypothetical protein HU752_030465 [Pseudomonas vanderleydeniana]
MALARSRRLGIADLLGFDIETKRKKGVYFPSGRAFGAMTDSRSTAFFPPIVAHRADESFPRIACRATEKRESAIYDAISKVFDIALASP